MKRLVVAAVAAGVVFGAAAVPKTFRWTPPTMNTDGSVLLPADLASNILRCQGQPDVSVPGGTTATFVQDYGPGTYVCELYAVHVNGNVSAASNQAGFTVPLPVPVAVTDFSVD